MTEIVEAYFKEYDTLRDEVLQSITHRTQIISFGFGAIATFITGTILVDVPSDEPTLAVVIFAVVIPLMSVIFLLLWYSELVRMFRASNHLGKLEEKINEKLDDEVLTWEHGPDVVDRRRKLFRAYLLVILAFTLVGIAAPMVGVAVTEYGFMKHWWAWVFQIIVGIALIGLLWGRARQIRLGEQASESGA